MKQASKLWGKVPRPIRNFCAFHDPYDLVEDKRADKWDARITFALAFVFGCTSFLFTDGYALGYVVGFLVSVLLIGRLIGRAQYHYGAAEVRKEQANEALTQLRFQAMEMEGEERERAVAFIDHMQKQVDEL